MFKQNMYALQQRSTNGRQVSGDPGRRRRESRRAVVRCSSGTCTLSCHERVAGPSEGVAEVCHSRGSDCPDWMFQWNMYTRICQPRGRNGQMPVRCSSRTCTLCGPEPLLVYQEEVLENATAVDRNGRERMFKRNIYTRIRQPRTEAASRPVDVQAEHVRFPAMSL